MKNKRLALIWISVQILLAALLTIISKLAFNSGIEPVNFSYQILLAASIFLGFYAIIVEPKKVFKIDKTAMLYTVLAGIVGGGLAYSFGFLGLKYSSVVNYSFLQQTSLVFTAAFAYLLLKEHLRPYKVMLIILLLAGSYLISTSGRLIIPRTGDLLILAGSLTFSLGIILAKKALDTLSPVIFSMHRAFYGAVSLMVFLLAIRQLSFEINWIWVLPVGAIVALGILSVNKVLEYSNASYMAMMSALIPVTAAIFAFAFLQETISVPQIIGGCIVIASSILIHRLGV